MKRHGAKAREKARAGKARAKRRCLTEHMPGLDGHPTALHAREPQPARLCGNKEMSTKRWHAGGLGRGCIISLVAWTTDA